MPFLLPLLFVFALFSFESHASYETEALKYIERGQWERLEQVLPRLTNSVIRTVAQWYHLTHNGQVASFSEYQAFIERHPDWPQQDKLLMRAELALISNGAPVSAAREWLSRHAPRTARGKFFLEEHRTQGKPSAAAIRDVWVQGDFSDIDEKRFLVNYRATLSIADHIARTDRLLWEGKISAASRMLLRVPREEQTMFEARIALMKRKGNFDALLARVPVRLKNAPGLLFERIRFRFDKEMFDGMTELLQLAPKQLPYPSKWWPYQRYAIREAMDAGNYKLAHRLASAHGQKDKIELSEALWIKAWLEVTFLRQPKPALIDFTRMYDVVEFPVSKSRAAYWVGRAARAAGDAKKAREWFQRAAQHPTTFYGQIAFEEMYGDQPLVLPKPSATVTEQEWQKLLASSHLANAVIQLNRLGHDQLSLPFLTHLAQSSKSAKMAAFAAHTGWKTGRADLAVRAAKEALNKGYYLPDYLFPIDMTPPSLAIEPALAYAIARQESMFYPKARSSADARGMMQVLPSTGRLVAAKQKLRFTPERLYEQDFNFAIGSYYLRSLLDKFGGTKIYAIAGYNAGPGRPLKWKLRYGALSANIERNIDWIERIPFSETRNYVQRVLENYQVYRVMLDPGRPNITAKASLKP